VAGLGTVERLQAEDLLEEFDFSRNFNWDDYILLVLTQFQKTRAT
jgi:hypothetical protein